MQSKIAQGILSVFLLLGLAGKSQAIRTFGESFTIGYGANSYECYPDRLAQIVSYPTEIHAYGGDRTGDTRNRILLDSAHKNYPTIIWTGYNNIDQTSQCVSDIESAVSLLGHQKYIVISVLSNPERPKGTGLYDNTITVNNQLKHDLGIRFLDVRDSMVHYKSGDSYWDSVSIADDVPNHYLMWDRVHCNAAGYYYVAQKVAQKQAILFGGVLAVDSVRQTPRRARTTILHYDVYNLNGVLLKQFTSASALKAYDILDPYPEGVYIICINGKCTKFVRW